MYKYKIDLHIHSIYSYDHIAKATFLDIVKAGKLKGLDGLCITDHNSFDGMIDFEKALVWAEKNNIVLLRGIELSTRSLDILAYGLTPENYHLNKILKNSSKYTPQLVIDELNRLGVVSVVAHPYRPSKFKPVQFIKITLGTVKKLKNYTALEGYNGSNLLLKESSKIFDFNKKVITNMKELGITKFTGGSDAHFPKFIGKCYTVFTEKINNMDDLIENLKKGNFYGRPSYKSSEDFKMCRVCGEKVKRIRKIYNICYICNHRTHTKCLSDDRTNKKKRCKACII